MVRLQMLPCWTSAAEAEGLWLAVLGQAGPELVLVIYAALVSVSTTTS